MSPLGALIRCAVEELAQRHAEPSGKPIQGRKRGVGTAVLEIEQVLNAESRLLGQSFLRRLLREPQLSDPLPELHQGAQRFRIGASLRPPGANALLPDPRHVPSSAANPD